MFPGFKLLSDNCVQLSLYVTTSVMIFCKKGGCIYYDINMLMLVQTLYKMSKGREGQIERIVKCVLNNNLHQISMFPQCRRLQPWQR